MKTHIPDLMAHLEGDMTISGAADNINMLFDSLDQMEAESKTCIKINCKQIDETDIYGLHLLHVWIDCARTRGVKPTLVNMTEAMKRAIFELGFSKSFSEACPDMERPA